MRRSKNISALHAFSFYNEMPFQVNLSRSRLFVADCMPVTQSRLGRFAGRQMGMWWCVGLLALNASAALISTFQAGDSSWHLGTLAVGNLDTSPDLEIVVPYRTAFGSWYLDAFKFDGRRMPGFPYSSGGEEMNVSPTLCDLDGDSRDEIIFIRGNSVIALRGNGSVLWSNRVNSATYVPNGGFQTVTNGFYWSGDSSLLNRLPSSAEFSSPVSPPVVADINGDGINEVITAWKINPDPINGGQDFNPFINDIFGSGEWGTMGETWSGGVVFFNASNGNQDFVYHLHHLLEAGLAVGHADWKPALNVYALNDSDGVVSFDKTRPFGLWGKGMLHKQFGKNQRLMTGSYQVPIDIYAADIDGDGLDEVLVAGTQLSSMWQPNETILDDDGAILWRRWLPRVDTTHNYGWHNSSCLIPVNPDHDNHIDVLGFNHSYEITFRYWNGVELRDHSGWPKNFYPLLPAPPVVGDVDGDGAEEIVIGTYHPALTPSVGNLMIYALDGTLKLSVPVVGGIKQIPSLADVDADGGLDVIYRSTLGQVYVQNFGATNAARVSWSTHRGNKQRDGNHNVSLFPAGTPLVTGRASGYLQASFSWTASSAATGYRIYRADGAEGPFRQLATVTANTTSYTDTNLRPGWQYLYEVGAVYSTNTIHSAPFAILSLLNSNLIANAGFEENENSHWDKWFTGTIPATNMVCSSDPFQGKQAMRIVLESQDDNSTIAQCNQYGLPDSSIPVTPGALYSLGAWFKSGGISQPSEHWLEWSSTKTASNTNNRPALPWPNYFTPHFVAGTSATDWLYVNRVFQMPAGFPNIELRHRYTIAAPGSGSVYLDNIFFRQLPPPTATNWTDWVSFASTWKFSATPAPANWISPEFNDSAWALGQAKFGTGGGPTNIVTALPPQRPAYYFRKQFVGTSAIEELLLAATCTDDYGGAIFPLRVFLNGTEITSSGIEAVTGAGNEVRYFDLTPFSQLLRLGINTIAVQLNNTWDPAWDNVAFDLSLKAVPRPVSTPRLSVSGSVGNGTQLVLQTPAHTIWRIESCDGFTEGPWKLVQTVTNTDGLLNLLDSGQNGRPPPQNVRARFYRLVPF